MSASIIKSDYRKKRKKWMDSHPQRHHLGGAVDGRECWSLQQQNLEHLCLIAGGAVGVPCMACTGNPGNRAKKSKGHTNQTCIFNPVVRVRMSIYSLLVEILTTFWSKTQLSAF